MNPKKLRTVVAIGCILALAGTATSADALGEGKVDRKTSDLRGIAHRFHWTDWLNKKGTEVFMDGVSFGKGDEAGERLAQMIFPEGTKLEINLPELTTDAGFAGISKDGFLVEPYYSVKNFLNKWLIQGVCVEFLINGKRHEIHTLASTDKEGNALVPYYAGIFGPDGLTSGRFYFDGKRYNSVEEAAKAMGAVEWGKGSILMICFPENNQLVLDFKPRPSNGIATVVLNFLIGRNVMIVDLGLPLL